MSNVRFGRRPIIAHPGSHAKTSKTHTHSLGSFFLRHWSSREDSCLSDSLRSPVCTWPSPVKVTEPLRWFPPFLFCLTGPYLAVCVGLKNRQRMNKTKQKRLSWIVLALKFGEKTRFKQRAHGKAATPRRFRWSIWSLSRGLNKTFCFVFSSERMWKIFRRSYGQFQSFQTDTLGRERFLGLQYSPVLHSCTGQVYSIRTW